MKEEQHITTEYPQEELTTEDIYNYNNTSLSILTPTGINPDIFIPRRTGLTTDAIIIQRPRLKAYTDIQLHAYNSWIKQLLRLNTISYIPRSQIKFTANANIVIKPDKTHRITHDFSHLKPYHNIQNFISPNTYATPQTHFISIPQQDRSHESIPVHSIPMNVPSTPFYIPALTPLTTFQWVGSSTPQLLMIHMIHYIDDILIHAPTLSLQNKTIHTVIHLLKTTTPHKSSKIRHQSNLQPMYLWSA
eukprot:GHVP01010410.1.p1 GENE.GHVP01010410.1~~GHVP01010410.1.p1  ORF type:complete len:247 (-),score=8.12 GHVP01010410.1:123-863(-)